jgi:hypothetical protein
MATAARFTDVKTVSAETASRWQDGSIPRMGEGKKGQGCYTVDGLSFWSYSTCIAVVDHASHTIALNITKYSATTNRYARMLRYTLPAMYKGYWVFESDPGVFHVQPDVLLALAKGVEVDGEIGDTVSGLVDAGTLPEVRSIQESHIEYNRYGFGHVKRSRSTLI